MGSNKRSIDVIIDTGTSDLIVQNELSTFCQQVSCDYGTADLTSGTLQIEKLRAISIQYLSGLTVNADLVKDTITIGGRAVPEASFGIARESTFAKNVLGIGYAANEALLNTVRYPNLPQRLKDVGLIRSVAYSLSLNSQGSGSGILFGGIDTGKFKGKLTSLALEALSGQSERTQLAVSVSGVAFGNLKRGPFQAILDSAQTRISLQSDIVSKIHAVAGVKINKNSNPVRSCALSEAESKMILTFQFAAAVIRVPMKDLLIQESTEPGNYTPLEAGLCYFGVYNAGDEVPTLAMPFFQSAYLVVNLERNEVSLAQANHSGGGKIIEIAEGGVAALGELANGEPEDGTLNAGNLDYSKDGQFVVDTANSQLPVVDGGVATPELEGTSIHNNFAFHPPSSDAFSANFIPSPNLNLLGDSGVPASSDMFLSSANSASTLQSQTNPAASSGNAFVSQAGSVPAATVDNTQFPGLEMSNLF